MEYKLAILIREDLKLPKGKMAVQAAHASCEAVMRGDKNKIKKWYDSGQKKIVLKVKDIDELLRYVNVAKVNGVKSYVIKDAGRTTVEPGTITAGSIGPDEDEKVDRIISKLKLM